MIPSARLGIALASSLLFPVTAMADDQKVDDGTDPTRLSTSFSLSYEGIDLPNGGDLQTLFLKYGTPISADSRTGLNLKLPIASTSFGDSGFGPGDFSVKLTRVAAVTPSYGLVFSAEAVFDTADAPDRGAGVDVLKLAGIYAAFLPSGAIFAPSLQHSVSLGDPDAGRLDVNLTTLDLYYVPRLPNPKAYMTLDPAINYDWETDRLFGALAVTYGQSVDLGIVGNESFFIKPSAGIGGDRVGGFRRRDRLQGDRVLGPEIGACSAPISQSWRQRAASGHACLAAGRAN
ncbi:MAG: hypothetical protein NTW20_00545 [Rhodobacterales bacterium]|nr:hypothetical protein [Rhodobacterales bacterium]